MSALPDCGNDCDGPNGHTEGCPVHCSCYDDWIVREPAHITHEPIRIQHTDRLRYGKPIENAKTGGAL